MPCRKSGRRREAGGTGREGREGQEGRAHANSVGVAQDRAESPDPPDLPDLPDPPDLFMHVRQFVVERDAALDLMLHLVHEFGVARVVMLVRQLEPGLGRHELLDRPFRVR